MSVASSEQEDQPVQGKVFCLRCKADPDIVNLLPVLADLYPVRKNLFCEIKIAHKKILLMFLTY